MVADGASANRKFFASHSIEEHKKSDITFKAPNIPCQEILCTSCAMYLT